ncbi:MAG: hypothetical protein OEU95_02795 [Nitrospirota bacterium]|nr:hypothetical protein [Nitrospirota bacterium]
MRLAFSRLMTAVSGLFVLGLFIVMPASAEQGVLSLRYPPDRTVIEYDILDVSIGVDKGAVDLIKVNVNGRERASAVPDRDHECFSLPLDPGMNEITVSAFRNRKPLDRIIFSAFRRSEIESAYHKAPDGFMKKYFHMGDTAECSACHILESRESDEMPISPASFTARNFSKEAVISSTSTCYSCHKEITSRQYVHGPAAVWSCLSCHEKGSEPRYSVKKPDREICFKCHVEQRDDWSSKKVVHGPVNLGKCTICHSPHSANNPFNLFKPTWNLCTTCHAEKGSGQHVLGDSFSTGGHPTHGRPDPLRKGKELSCASCHEPHASNFLHLWAFDVQNLFELCKKCHYDK